MCEAGLVDPMGSGATSAAQITKIDDFRYVKLKEPGVLRIGLRGLLFESDLAFLLGARSAVFGVSGTEI